MARRASSNHEKNTSRMHRGAGPGPAPDFNAIPPRAAGRSARSATATLGTIGLTSCGRLAARRLQVSGTQLDKDALRRRVVGELADLPVPDVRGSQDEGPLGPLSAARSARRNLDVVLQIGVLEP